MYKKCRDAFGIRKKKNKLKLVGKELFWKYGIRRVFRGKEICSAAGVSRMIFIKYFPNKTQLAISIPRRQSYTFTDGVQECMDSKGSFDSKIGAIIKLKITFSKDLSTEFLQELYASGTRKIIRFVRKWTEKTMEMVRLDFEEARLKGGNPA